MGKLTDKVAGQTKQVVAEVTGDGKLRRKVRSRSRRARKSL
jgi:hypothetical protein